MSLKPPPNTKPISYDELQRLKGEAKDHERQGGNAALFWAGAMSHAASKLPLCSPLELSAQIQTLEMIRKEYDRTILKKLPQQAKKGSAR